MWNRVLNETESKMKKTVQVTEDELSKIRSGRANPSLLDAVSVRYYGAATPLKQLATLIPRTIFPPPITMAT